MDKQSQLEALLERFKTVVSGGDVPRPAGQFTTYAITNFRGGIGKSTLAFNLAWEISRPRKAFCWMSARSAILASLFSGTTYRALAIRYMTPYYLA